MKIYQKPEAEFISLVSCENITIDLGDISNPFDRAVAEDEAIEQAEREAAMQGKS